MTHSSGDDPEVGSHRSSLRRQTGFEGNSVPKRSEFEPGTGLAERDGYATESHRIDGLTLEFFSILTR